MLGGAYIELRTFGNASLGSKAFAILLPNTSIFCQTSLQAQSILVKLCQMHLEAPQVFVGSRSMESTQMTEEEVFDVVSLQRLS